jgi:Ca2+-transporting ATPase
MPRGTGLAMDRGMSMTAEQARARLAIDGANEIRRAAVTPWWRTLLAQFRGVMIWLLLGACAVALLVGEDSDAIAIAAIVAVNALVGYLQERRAERAVLALRSLTAPRATVVRDGLATVIPAAEVVAGDELVLEAGNIVAADARLVEAHALSVGEATLTGESLPVEKRVGADVPDAPLAERPGWVFMGTTVATGTARALVVATGMRTELGKIAHLLERAEPIDTPLQQRLEQVARTLVVVCLGIVVVIGALGVVRGLPWIDVLLSSVSLAVAAVPEGLAAIVTIALAIGVQRMAARHVLVRRLPSVETLGCATVICTDKTGTLTTGVMGVRELWGADHEAILDAAAACCDAELGAVPGSGTGDPTELAILAEARVRGIERAEIERTRRRVSITPFDSQRKRMSIQRADGRLYVKGAVDVLVPLCRAGVAGALEANAELARRGLRVLAVAVGDGAEERELTLLGLVGLADPPRAEAIAAIAEARAAGIETVMITGDHPVTALASARELGLVRPGEDAAGRVHARATAEDKLRIVRGLVERGEIVAMTGDGVNDAPALREAHIGIAMGRTGTEVTREASAMILTDDNYASIVAAVREGRGIYDNIRKTLVYLLAGNTAELAVMLGASLAGWPLPLLPLSLLWINLVTDGLPALALVMDPAPADALARPPRRPAEPMLGSRQWTRVALTGLLEAGVTLAVFAWTLRTRGLAEARSLAFAVLVFSELFRAFAARSDRLLFWQVGAFSNLVLLAIVVGSVVLQIGLHELPFSRQLFGLSVLAWSDAVPCLLAALVPVSVLELLKLVRRHGRADPSATARAHAEIARSGPAVAASGLQSPDRPSQRSTP